MKQKPFMYVKTPMLTSSLKTKKRYHISGKVPKKQKKQTEYIIMTNDGKIVSKEVGKTA